MQQKGKVSRYAERFHEIFCYIRLIPVVPNISDGVKLLCTQVLQQSAERVSFHPLFSSYKILLLMSFLECGKGWKVLLQTRLPESSNTEEEEKRTLRSMCNSCRRIREETVKVRECQRKRRCQRREQEKENGITPQIQRFPSSTSKFALKVYSEVFDALTAYNIRFKNGVQVSELLVQADLAGQKKPLTIVIEVQG